MAKTFCFSSFPKFASEAMVSWPKPTASWCSPSKSWAFSGEVTVLDGRSEFSRVQSGTGRYAISLSQGRAMIWDVLTRVGRSLPTVLESRQVSISGSGETIVLQGDE